MLGKHSAENEFLLRLYMQALSHISVRSMGIEAAISGSSTEESRGNDQKLNLTALHASATNSGVSCIRPFEAKAAWVQTQEHNLMQTKFACCDLLLLLLCPQFSVSCWDWPCQY